MRQLNANLSAFIRMASSGVAVTVSVRNRPVARIVPLEVKGSVNELTMIPGVQWNGGKPAGLAKVERMRRGMSLSKWAGEDRR